MKFASLLPFDIASLYIHILVLPFTHCSS